MNRSRGEGDTVRLTNPGPNPTIAGAIGTVGGFATVCNAHGVPAGEKAPYSVTGRFLATAKTAAAAIAEGDELKLDADGNLVKSTAASAVGEVVGKALDGLAANKTGDIWFRLPPQ